MKAKERHSRTARTLGCLVASMTLGAVFLDLIQPGSTASAKLSPIAPLNGSRTSWRSIHVIAQRSGQPRETHWVVDRDGRAVPTDQWNASHRLTQAGEIRISLIAPAQSNDITPRQWSSARELLSRLQQEYNIPGKLVAIDDTLELPRIASPASIIRHQS